MHQAFLHLQKLPGCQWKNSSSGFGYNLSSAAICSENSYGGDFTKTNGKEHSVPTLQLHLRMTSKKNSEGKAYVWNVMPRTRSGTSVPLGASKGGNFIVYGGRSRAICLVLCMLLLSCWRKEFLLWGSQCCPTYRNLRLHIWFYCYKIRKMHFIIYFYVSFNHRINVSGLKQISLFITHSSLLFICSALFMNYTYFP